MTQSDDQGITVSLLMGNSLSDITMSLLNVAQVKSVKAVFSNYMEMDLMSGNELLVRDTVAYRLVCQDSGLSNLGSIPWQGYCDMLLDRALYSHSASLH